MLKLLKWPITFFGRECFPIWRLTQADFIGPAGNFSKERRLDETVDAAICHWKMREPVCCESLEHFGHAELEIAYDKLRPQSVLLLQSKTIIGEYSQRMIIIRKDYRGRGLATILILAKATVLNDIPNRERQYTEAGRAAMTNAYQWVCNKQKEFERNQKSGIAEP